MGSRRGEKGRRREGEGEGKGVESLEIKYRGRYYPLPLGFFALSFSLHGPIPHLKAYRGRQWETASLILCLHWAACANACGTNRGWRPFCFSIVLMQESGSFSREDLRSHKSPLFNTQMQIEIEVVGNY